MARAAVPAAGGERRLVLWMAGLAVVVILLSSILRPPPADDDPSPTTYNAGSAGTEAAFLLLGESGYDSKRWLRPTGELAGVDARTTTLILTTPDLPFKDLAETQRNIADFLRRGGRVVATDASGARLLPNGSTAAPVRLYKSLCYTTPEGAGALARAGEVPIGVEVRWGSSEPRFQVAQRCGADPVVVRYRVGAGEAIWWSSPRPMSNRGLGDPDSTRLLLASVGAPGRTVLFDEYLHEAHESVFSTLHGLPWWWLGGQALLVGVLLVLSRGRRNGPLRAPVGVPRSSPLEFAESMGRLYERAGASPAAVGAARLRLQETLRGEAGVGRESLQAGAAATQAAVEARFGGDWSALGRVLGEAEAAESTTLRPRNALALVQALEAQERAVRDRARQAVTV